MSVRARGLSTYLSELCDASFRVFGRYPPELLEFLNVDLSRSSVSAGRRRSDMGSDFGGAGALAEEGGKRPGWLVWFVLVVLKLMRLPFLAVDM